MSPDWIAVDWGTSRLRVWAMRGGEAVGEASSGDGMGVLAGQGFEAALLRLIAPWLGEGRMPVIAAGMVGARRGWVEAAYLPAPLSLDVLGGALTVVPVQDPRLEMHIIPGVSQAGPADVMRGEETQLLGLSRLREGYSGAVCLPGTHSKWATLDRGRLTGFRTAMTGEIFDLIATRSVIAAVLEDGTDDEGFDEGLRAARADPGALTALIFSLRAEALLHGGSGTRRRARLSGMLIGAEVSAIGDAGGEVAVIGSPALAPLYARAIESAGGTARIEDSTRTTLAGLTAIREMLS